MIAGVGEQQRLETRLFGDSRGGRRAVRAVLLTFHDGWAEGDRFVPAASDLGDEAAEHRPGAQEFQKGAPGGAHRAGDGTAKASEKSLEAGRRAKHLPRDGWGFKSCSSEVPARSWGGGRS